MNVGQFLLKARQVHSNSVAVIYGNETLTYSELADCALRVASALRALGLREGDRVAFALQNCPEIFEIMYGAFLGGFVVVPLNCRLHLKEVEYVVGHCDAKVFFFNSETHPELSVLGSMPGVGVTLCDVGRAGSESVFESWLRGATVIEKVAEPEPNDPAWLFYTSGTTGRPKGATLTHRNLVAMSMNYLADVYAINSRDVLLHVAPLSHGSGLVALPGVARGAGHVISKHASFDPVHMFTLVEEYGVSHVAFMAPTQIVRSVEEYSSGVWNLSSLKAICYGGAPIYVHDLKRALETFGPVFVQIFGQGECPITATSLSQEHHKEFWDSNDVRLGSVGIPRTDVEVQVVNEYGGGCAIGEAGEVLVRGDVVMAGYWRDDIASSEALGGGWLHTGDVGTFDESGFLFLLDRKKDVVISGGNNVYPTEVESVLITHPEVRQTVVVGVPDSYWGEAVRAVVVRHPDSTVTAEELVSYCREHLAGYKCPKAVDFVGELPVSAYGKVLRREVRAWYWEGYDRTIAGGTPAQS